MTKQQRGNFLTDHVDMRMVATDLSDPSVDRNAIVQLDPDHPGFRDEGYRIRRNTIARIAADYEPGMAIPDAPYTDDEHKLWQTIIEALQPAHQRYACVEYLECVDKLDLPRERLPQLSEVSEKVQALSGFRLEPVAGLVEPRVFLESLADNVFLCTQYIRHHSTPHYTPEPDVVHEITGHAVTLASARLAELNRLFGKAVRMSGSTDVLERLSRIYWFTIEFGVVRERADIKAYGTGLLSSAGELEVMQHAELRQLEPELMSKEEYDPTKYQPVLFCADSFEAMYETMREFLINWN